MSADQVTVPELGDDTTALLYAHLPFPEVAMQPFLSNQKRNAMEKPFFFHAGATFENVVFSRDLAGSDIIKTGTLTLGQNIFVDTNMLNEDPQQEHHEHGHDDSKGTSSNSRGLTMQPHCQIKPMNTPEPEHRFKKYVDTIVSAFKSRLLGPW